MYEVGLWPECFHCFYFKLVFRVWSSSVMFQLHSSHHKHSNHLLVWGLSDPLGAARPGLGASLDQVYSGGQTEGLLSCSCAVLVIASSCQMKLLLLGSAGVMNWSIRLNPRTQQNTADDQHMFISYLQTQSTLTQTETWTNSSHAVIIEICWREHKKLSYKRTNIKVWSSLHTTQTKSETGCCTKQFLCKFCWF